MKNKEIIKALLDHDLSLDSNISSVEAVGGKIILKPIDTPTEPIQEPVEPEKEPPIEQPDPVVEQPNDLGLKGDGVSDDKPVLQKLLAEHIGKTLTLPSGTFLLSSELDLPANTTLQGHGEATVLKLSGSAGKNRRVLRIAKRTSNYTVRNLKLNSNAEEHTDKANHCFFIEEGVKNVTIEGVVFEGSREIGCLKVDGTPTSKAENINLKSCKFISAGRSAIEFRGVVGFKVVDCLFTGYGKLNPDSPGLQLQSVVCSDFVIEGNTFDNTLGKQFAIESAAQWMSNGKISNNTFNDPKNLGGSGISGYFQNVEISNNVFKGGIGHHRSGIELFGSNHEVLDNTIERGSMVIASGHKQKGDTSNVQGNIKVIGNKVKVGSDNTPALFIAGAGKDMILDGVEVKGNILDASGISGVNTNTPAINIGTYAGQQTVVKNILIEGNELISKADNRVIRLETGKGSNKVTIRKNVLRGGDYPLNYKTDNTDGFEFYDNEVLTKNKDFYFSVKATKIIKF